MQELGHVQLLTSRLSALALKHRLKSEEQTPTPQEIEEIKRKLTDLPVRRSAHLLQIENQRTESTILHQLVE
jgi:hypothetical protein